MRPANRVLSCLLSVLLAWSLVPVSPSLAEPLEGEQTEDVEAEVAAPDSLAEEDQQEAEPEKNVSPDVAADTSEESIEIVEPVDEAQDDWEGAKDTSESQENQEPEAVAEPTEEALPVDAAPEAEQPDDPAQPEQDTATPEDVAPELATEQTDEPEDVLELMEGNATPGWKRLSGKNAYDTMKAIVDADELFATNRGKTVIVATGDGYWDALAASGLAGRLDAPVLITPTNSLASQTKATIQRLKPERILVMGGELAISKGVFTQLKGLAKTVTRVSGATAVDTAIEIYESAPAWSKTAIVATSNGYWDALSIAPYAYANGSPIFLTNLSSTPANRVLSNATLQAIKAGGFERVVIVGGELAVAKKVETQLSGIGVSTVRKYGQNAVDTSAAIAKFEIAEGVLDTEHLVVATNNGYWDALSGAAYAGKFGSVLVLVGNDGQYQAFDAVYDYDNPSAVTYGRILGGQLAVSDEAMTRITCPWCVKSVKVDSTCVQTGTKVTVTATVEGDTTGLKYNYLWNRNGSWASGEWGSTKLNTGSYATSATGPMTFKRPGVYSILVEGVDASDRKSGLRCELTVWSLQSLDISTNADGTWTALANIGVDGLAVSGEEYRYTWKNNSTGATGVLCNWTWNNRITFGEGYLTGGPGAYTITVEARYGGKSVGTKSGTLQYDAMTQKAQQYYSSTGQLILVDCSANRVGIYTGHQGAWNRIRYNTVSTGAPSTPTVKGVFTVGIKGYVFGDYYSCYYYTQFYGDYLFHSILYDPGTFNVQDGRLGQNLSHGCVRMALNDAKWIYDNIAYGTTVVVY